MESSFMPNKPCMVQHNPIISRSMEDLRQPMPEITSPLFDSVADEKWPAAQFVKTPKSEAAIIGLGR